MKGKSVEPVKTLVLERPFAFPQSSHSKVNVCFDSSFYRAS